jgi:hypothetical protein
MMRIQKHDITAEEERWYDVIPGISLAGRDVADVGISGLSRECGMANVTATKKYWKLENIQIKQSKIASQNDKLCGQKAA